MSTELEVVKDNAKLTAITVQSGHGAEIATAQDAWTLATMYHRAGMAPTSFKTPQQVFVAFLAASELGVGPSFAMRWMMVINNVPAVWGDGPMALVERSGLQEAWSTGTVGVRGTDEFGVWFETTRKGRQPHRVTFTKGDAVHAGLWNKAGPWKSYPERMMLARARAFALRNTYPDVLGGVAIAEEERDHERVSSPEEPATGSEGLLRALAKGDEPAAPEDPEDPLDDAVWSEVESHVAERDGKLFAEADA